LCSKRRERLQILRLICKLSLEAYPPSKEAAAAAAINLGLPKENWQRTDFLTLLKRIADSLDRISEHLEAAAEQLA
jgi:hypothetical protein